MPLFPRSLKRILQLVFGCLGLLRRLGKLEAYAGGIRQKGQISQTLSAEKGPSWWVSKAGRDSETEVRKGTLWRGGRAEGVSPLLLEVRKGSLGRVPSPPTPSSFLRRARMGRGQELVGADGALFKELSLRASLQIQSLERERRPHW